MLDYVGIAAEHVQKDMGEEDITEDIIKFVQTTGNSVLSTLVNAPTIVTTGPLIWEDVAEERADIAISNLKIHKH